MKRRLLAPLAVLAIAVHLSCASSPPKTAFDALGVTAIAVDTAMKTYADLVVAGKIPQATQDKVRQDFAAYQTAMKLAQGAVDTWFALGAPPAAFPASEVGKAISAAGVVQGEAK